MKLGKQLKALNWGTPVKISTAEEVLFEGSAKNAVGSQQLLNYTDNSLKDVKLETEGTRSYLHLILKVK